MIRVGPWAKRLLHDVATAPWARPGVSESVEAIPKFGFQLREHPSGLGSQPGKPRGRLSYLEEPSVRVDTPSEGVIWPHHCAASRHCI
jgi:hypothetical protein